MFPDLRGEPGSTLQRFHAMRCDAMRGRSIEKNGGFGLEKGSSSHLFLHPDLVGFASPALFASENGGEGGGWVPFGSGEYFSIMIFPA